MSVSAYSIVMALFYCGMLALLLAVLRRKTELFSRSGSVPAFCLALCTVLRMCLPVEFPNVKLWSVGGLYPALQSVWNSSPLPPVRVGDMVMVLWLVGALASGAKFGSDYLRTRRGVRAMPAAASPEMAAVMAELGDSGKRLRLVRAEGAGSPALFGFLRPTVILPDLDLSKEELRFVLSHEYQHYKRRDNWTKLTVYFVCCVFWWNPLIYFIKHDLDCTLEIRCDLAVIKKLREEERKRYYAAIIKVIKQISINRKLQKQPFITSLVSTKKEPFITQRFKIGLNYKKPTKLQILATALFCVLIIALCLATYTFQIQPGGQPPEEDGGFSVYDDTVGYLIEHEDGTYTCYIDGVDVGTLNVKPTVEPFDTMPIYEEGEIINES